MQMNSRILLTPNTQDLLQNEESNKTSQEQRPQFPTSPDLFDCFRQEVPESSAQQCTGG